MTQIEKNEILAKYLGFNLHLAHIVEREKLQWNLDWNNLMKVANKLKDETQYLPFSFTQNELSFDIKTLFDNCFETVHAIEKYKQQYR